MQQQDDDGVQDDSSAIALQDTLHRLQDQSHESQDQPHELQGQPHELQDQSHRLQDQSHELQDQPHGQSHELQDQPHELQHQSHELQHQSQDQPHGQSHELQDQSHELQDQSHRLQDQSHELQDQPHEPQDQLMRSHAMPKDTANDEDADQLRGHRESPQRHDISADSGYNSTPESRRPHTLPMVGRTTVEERWTRASPETTPTDGRTQMVHGMRWPVMMPNNGQMVTPGSTPTRLNNGTIVQVSRQLSAPPQLDCSGVCTDNNRRHTH